MYDRSLASSFFVDYGRPTAHAIHLRALLALKLHLLSTLSQLPDHRDVQPLTLGTSASSSANPSNASHVFKSRTARLQQLSIPTSTRSGCIQGWLGWSSQASRLATSKCHVISDSPPQQHTDKAIIISIFPSLHRRWYLTVRLFTQFESTTMRSHHSISQTLRGTTYCFCTRTRIS